jgi:hypothetical protein
MKHGDAVYFTSGDQNAPIYRLTRVQGRMLAEMVMTANDLDRRLLEGVGTEYGYRCTEIFMDMPLLIRETSGLPHVRGAVVRRVNAMDGDGEPTDVRIIGGRYGIIRLDGEAFIAGMVLGLLFENRIELTLKDGEPFSLTVTVYDDSLAICYFPIGVADKTVDEAIETATRLGQLYGYAMVVRDGG